MDQAVFQGHISPYVGPETPGFGALYDPGNYPQYSYNVTLAQHLLTEANITNFPAIDISMPAGFTVMTNDVAMLSTNLGITLNIQTYSYQTWITHTTTATPTWSQP